jgi:NAD(P)-dependent dehydrogenase (short-subunit alcohol dehydrogenase family)
VSLVGKKIVALVHNAAQIEPLTPLLQLPLDQFEQQWRVNVMAPLALTQCCLPYFEAKARVLLLSSGAAHRSAAGMRPYSVTKAALYNAYQGLRTELMSTDILCASAKPGVIDTPMQQAIRQAAAFGEQDLQPYVQYEASGLLIAPELVGLWLAWLLKDVSDADYVQPVEWDIYEKKWQPQWLPEGVVLPER